jgi:hypothetical protein
LASVSPLAARSSSVNCARALAMPAELGIHHGVPDHDAAVPPLVNDHSDVLRLTAQ